MMLKDGQIHSFPSVSKSIPTPEKREEREREKKKEKKEKSKRRWAQRGQGGVNQMDMSYHPDNAVNAHD
jgi:hypothetical protein